jgi:hypothetical protein
VCLHPRNIPSPEHEILVKHLHHEFVGQDLGAKALRGSCMLAVHEYNQKLKLLPGGLQRLSEAAFEKTWEPLKAIRVDEMLTKCSP